MKKEYQILRDLAEAVFVGEEKRTVELAQEAVRQGLDPVAVIKEGMSRGVNMAGERFNEGYYFLPELMLAGEAMKAGLAVVMPLLEGRASREESLRIVLGTVEGDVHDLGKNILSSLAVAQGFEVLDLGVDNEVAHFVEMVRLHEPAILGLGSYMSTTLPRMPETIKALQVAGLRDKVKVAVGGVACTREYADRIGADGYAETAWEAVRLFKKITGQAA